MAGCGCLAQGPVPAPPSPPHRHPLHGCWVLSPQVSVSYYLSDEDVPVATAVLCLTGIGEYPGGWGGALLAIRPLLWVLGGPIPTGHPNMPIHTVPSSHAHSPLTSFPEHRHGKFPELLLSGLPTLNRTSILPPVLLPVVCLVQSSLSHIQSSPL